MATTPTSGDSNTIIENDSLLLVNNPVIRNVYTVYLTESIDEQKNYRQLFNQLRTATSEDTFVIYLNNFGGYVHTGIDIINSIRMSQAQVITCVTGPIYSMAPLVALSGDLVRIESDTFMMFHDYSTTETGKGSEVKAAVEHYGPFMKDLFKKITHKFLTKKEIEDILSGKDLYLGREEIVKRLKKIKRLYDKE